MPELPEVETIKRRLQKILPGKKFLKIEVFKDKSFQGESTRLAGVEISDVSRRAKLLNFHLSDGTFLLTHLKMTGQLIYLDKQGRVGGGHPTADWTKDLPGKHTRIHYSFDDDSQLFFNDMRIFGWMKLADSLELKTIYGKLGPDINDPSITPEYLFIAFQRRTVPIKQAIMNNDIVCGVGNIYACDALNLARISPFRPAQSLSLKEVTLLLQAAQEIIQRGIELEGTTFDGKYVNVDGMAGGYQDQVLTYGREGQPCKNCGAAIKKTKLGGRGTYYCDHCQI